MEVFSRIRRRLWAPFGLLVLGLAGMIVLGTCRPALDAKTPEPQAPLVRAVVTQPGEARIDIHTHGTVRPRTESNLVTELDGSLIETSPNFETGGFFRRGEVLARIDAADYEAALERARAERARAESEHDRARKELERRRALASSGAASPAQLDDALNRERVTAAQARAARAELSRAQRDLERTWLRAPFDGRVREKTADLGQFVKRGERIARLYAIDYAEILLPISDADMAHADVPDSSRGDDAADGPEVILSADWRGERREWSGRVVRTEGEIDPRTRMVRVVARVDDPYGRNGDAGRAVLPVGLFVEARILGRRVDGVFELPRAAMRGSDRIFVIDPDDRLRFRAVEILRARGEEVLVSAGLAAGERVCVSPLDAAVDGMRVRVAEPEAAG